MAIIETKTRARQITTLDITDSNYASLTHLLMASSRRRCSTGRADHTWTKQHRGVARSPAACHECTSIAQQPVPVVMVAVVVRPVKASIDRAQPLLDHLDVTLLLLALSLLGGLASLSLEDGFSVLVKLGSERLLALQKTWFNPP